MSKYYTLKPGQPEFRPVDGPCRGVTYLHGRRYNAIPPGMDGRFDCHQIRIKSGFGKTRQAPKKQPRIKTEGKGKGE